MKRNRIGDTNDTISTVLLWGGIGFGVYYVVKNVLPGLFSNLGLGVDPVVQAQQMLNPAANPFSYQFQPFIDFYNENAPQSVTTGNTANFLFSLLNEGDVSAPQSTVTSPTLQQFFVSLKESPPASSIWGFLDTVALSQIAENIYSSMQVGWGLTTNATLATSSILVFQNQLQVAFVANYLWWNYNVDMITYLQGSLLKGGLTPDILDQLIKTVNALPVNPS